MRPRKLTPQEVRAAMVKVQLRAAARLLFPLAYRNRIKAHWPASGPARPNGGAA